MWLELVVFFVGVCRDCVYVCRQCLCAMVCWERVCRCVLRVSLVVRVCWCVVCLFCLVDVAVDVCCLQLFGLWWCVFALILVCVFVYIFSVRSVHIWCVC